MNYKEKYEQSLERAKDMLAYKEVRQEDMEYLFPELQENKDEKIRKGLIKAVSGILKGNTLYGTDVTREEALTWLEKQGEQSVEPKWCHHKVDLSDYSEEYRKAYYDGWNNCNMQHSQREAESNNEDERMRKEIIDFLRLPHPQFVGKRDHEKWIDWLEKQGNKIVDCKQNHQDVKYPNGAIITEDFNDGEGFYKLRLDYLSKKQVEEVEEMVRTWNKESKTSNENIINCIGMCLTDVNEQRFKDYDTNLKDCLAWLEKQGESDETKAKMFLINKGYPIDTNGIFPTYEEMYNIIRDGLENQNPTWCEKDKNILNRLIGVLDGTNEEDYHEAWEETFLPWLKSLKERMQPQSKQYEYLEDFDNEEDYGIDGLYHAINILEKTIGRVEGYQSDDGILSHKVAINAVKELYKKQGEKKSVDKAESKFKVGDWCIDKQDGTIFRIEKVMENIYKYKTDKGNLYYCSHGSLELDSRLWTIEDVKDGDVLVNGSNIFIFHFINDTRLMGYCHVNIDDGRFYDDLGKNECFCLIDAVVNPATKEQRDLFFQKMKEAGYEWDSDKKELKKIEPKTLDVDKVIEWLRIELDKEEKRHYIHVHGFDKERREIFFEDFRKAMKGE